MQNIPENIIKVIKTNPEAASKFNDYFHEIEPEVFAAQKKFADEMNRLVQKAMKKFIESEKVNLSDEDIKNMEKESAAFCRLICGFGDNSVKSEFKKMSDSVTTIK